MQPRLQASPPLIYPINVARNIARRGMRTRLFVSGDIEQVFSDGYERRMRALGEQLLLRCATMVPAAAAAAAGAKHAHSARSHFQLALAPRARAPPL